MPEVDILAVLVAALVTFLLGGPWYSAKMFGAIWHRENGGGEPKAVEPGKKQGHPAIVFGTSYVLMVIAAYGLAVLLGPNPPVGHAMKTGFHVGLCFVATSFGVNYAFAGRTLKLWLIDAGYHTVQFTLFGLVLGLWH